MALRVTLHNSFERPELRAAWERLSAASPRASLFSTCEWCRAWADTVGHSADVAILLFEDQEGNVVGLLPACLERRGPVRWLKFLGREGVSGDHLGVFGVILPLDFVITSGAISRNTYILIFAIAMIAVILVGYLISRLIINPLYSLMRTSQAIAGGDLTQRTGVRSKPRLRACALTHSAVAARSL